MRRSNCSVLIPPRQPWGQTKNVRYKKGRGTRKKVIFVIIWGGAKKKWRDKKTGATQKKVISPGVPGGGIGAEQFDRRIIVSF